MVQQVGGHHYEGHNYQHWDWADENNIPYLEGCATKYLVRWRDKNGVEDLKKSITYFQKAEASHNTVGPFNPSMLYTTNLERFLYGIGTLSPEAHIIRMAAHCAKREYTHVIKAIERLIENEQNVV